MRYGLFLLLVASACNPDLADPPAAPKPASVRERLDDRTQLVVAAAHSGGAITAEHHVSGGQWEGGAVALQITNGELLVSSDAPDALTLDGLQVSFDTLQVPAGVFGSKDAKLTNVRLDLKSELRARAHWISDDEVHLQASVDLNLSWDLVLDGSVSPLGSPKLPLVPLELVLTGDGEQVNAAVTVHAPGELWNWASLVRLSELQLSLDASL
jgi:hypothetical protein